MPLVARAWTTIVAVATFLGAGACFQYQLYIVGAFLLCASLGLGAAALLIPRE